MFKTPPIPVHRDKDNLVEQIQIMVLIVNIIFPMVNVLAFYHLLRSTEDSAVDADRNGNSFLQIFVLDKVLDRLINLISCRLTFGLRYVWSPCKSDAVLLMAGVPSLKVQCDLVSSSSEAATN